ncbi:hypothetical protein PoB_005244600 [Plakobranchus ocellatus]|uniref:Uncharacterized protein n=1 Tax=Plakobranchus ocellatus TaxID=259542 RepID=A0AAV4BZI4_9GAST|nr:hypothetical protein PoB_005244600 [Plakobranchus ocellatus]
MRQKGPCRSQGGFAIHRQQNYTYWYIGQQWIPERNILISGWCLPGGPQWLNPRPETKDNQDRYPSVYLVLKSGFESSPKLLVSTLITEDLNHRSISFRYLTVLAVL